MPDPQEMAVRMMLATAEGLGALAGGDGDLAADRFAEATRWSERLRTRLAATAMVGWMIARGRNRRQVVDV